MKRGNIKNIIFDLGGVLIDLDFDESLKAFTKAGFKDIEKRVCQFSRDGVFSQYEVGLTSTENFRDFIRHECTLPLSDQEIDDMWNKIVIRIPHEKLDLILELRKKYKVYLLSNTNELHWIYTCDHMFNYRGLSVDDFFDKIFLSFKMHKAKPKPDIFKEMLEETKIVPEESLFIDDSEANCTAANEFGIRTYKYRIGEDINVIKTLL